MCGSRASGAYGKGGSVNGISFLLFSSRVVQPDRVTNPMKQAVAPEALCQAPRECSGTGRLVTIQLVSWNAEWPGNRAGQRQLGRVRLAGVVGTALNRSCLLKCIGEPEHGGLVEVFRQNL